MPMLLGFEDYETQGRKLAEQLGWPYEQVSIHHFPDGEVKVTLPSSLPEHVAFYRSLDHPNEKLVELLLSAKTARRLGAEKLTLVSPYLCYMRQDKEFSPGEAISQNIIGHFLAELFESVITVDPHLHRTHDFGDAVPAKHAVTLSASQLMRDFLCAHPHAILLGPDSESVQWVRSIAEGGGLTYGVANKQRLGDRQIKITLPDLEYSGKQVVLVDDVISSGETIAIAAKHCFEKGASGVDVLVTHPLFAQGAVERLQEVGVGEIWSSDSISHSSNCISLTDLLANAVKEVVKS
ncbi:ribose-phosphate diphosphokinase [Kaarinaea lacus]